MVGIQTPRIASYPEYDTSCGEEIIEFASAQGLHLDPWQQLILKHSMGQRKDGKWAAWEVGCVLPRQNGKDAILEARELAGLFLLNERLIIHSAHQFDTSLEHFWRLLFWIEENAELSRLVKKVSRSHGEEGVQLLNGNRIRFRTRTKGGGRGFSADLVLLNEAMVLPEATMGALMPTLSARPNPQLWYTGSAVDEEVHEHGVTLARVRERGLTGKDPNLAYFEFSAENGSEPQSPDTWAQSNPALGIRIPVSHVAAEQRSMDPRTFEVERLGIGYWPVTDGTDRHAIPLDAWSACADPETTIAGSRYWAFDVSPDRRTASIVVAGRNSEKHFHVEVVHHQEGTNGLVERLRELQKTHGGTVVCDSLGPAASLVVDLANLGTQVTTLTTHEVTRACGFFHDSVIEKRVRYPAPQPELDRAVLGATVRPLVDAWAWSRKNSNVDITPLVAATLATYQLNSTGAPMEWDFAEIMANLKEMPQMSLTARAGFP